MLDNMNIPADPQNDPLSEPPPHPDLKTAKKSRSKFPPASQDNAERGAKAAHMLGLSPAMELVKNMKDLENLVRNMSKHAPALQQVFAPAIAQGRDIAAASLSNLAQGGLAQSEMGAGPPPPGMGAPAGGPPAAGGGGVGGMAPMPPPMG